jgi:sugar/nucleoside kinase (ribokinase family)
MDVDGVVTIPGEQTSLGLIFVGAEGKRAILTVLGAHARMDVQVARDQERIKECREVFLCGNYLLPEFGPAAVLPYAQDLREAGKHVVFDPSWDPAGWPAQTQLDVCHLLDHVDLFMPNEPELCRLTGTTTWQDGAAALAAYGAELVVKRGEHGAVVIRDGVTTENPGYAVETVNTIGAGDIFDMGFLYGRRQGWSDARCLDFACATAALVVSQRGARHYPSASEVHQFLAAREAGR